MSFIDSFHRMSVDELRAEVITLLKAAYADGRIGVDTLERRLKEATGATDKPTLLGLAADIPPSESDAAMGAGSSRAETDWYVNDRVPRSSQSFFAVMGSAGRRGRWQPAKQILCIAVMGGIKLDFREAEFPRSGVQVNAGCIMGGLDIILPPGVNADAAGLPLMGSFDNKAGDGDPGAPTVRVRGIAVMGGVDIKRKERKAPPEDARRRTKGRRRG